MVHFQRAEGIITLQLKCQKKLWHIFQKARGDRKQNGTQEKKFFAEPVFVAFHVLDWYCCKCL